jgi:hypothetical protein
MKKTRKVIICLGIVLCTLVSTLIIKPLNEDPPSALSSPAYSNTIC